MTADTFQDTWVGLNGYFVAHSLPAYFGAQTPVNDYSLCQPFSITRVHNQSPPTTAVLQALLDVFKPTSAAAEQGRVNLPGQTRYVFSQLFVLLR